MKKQTNWAIKYSITMSVEFGGLVLLFLLLYTGVIQISYLRLAILTTLLVFPNIFGATNYVLARNYPLKLGNKGRGALEWVYSLFGPCVIGIVFGNYVRDSSIPVLGAIFKFWPGLWILLYFANAIIVFLAFRKQISEYYASYQLQRRRCRSKHDENKE